MKEDIFKTIKKEPKKDYLISFLLEGIVRQIEDKIINFDQKIDFLKTKNDPFHQLTLNYVLWRKDKEYVNAKNIIDIITSNINSVYENNWFHLSTFCVDMLFRICRETNQNKDFIKKWIHNSFSLIQKFSEKMGIVKVLDQCEILLSTIYRIDKGNEFLEDISSIIKILDNHILLAEKKGNFHLQRGIIELKIEFYKLLGREFLTLNEEIVLSFEKEGDKKEGEGNFMAANWIYNEALEAAKNFGLNKYYENLKKKLLKSGSKIKYKEIKINMDLKQIIDKKLKKYKISKNPLEDAKKDNDLIVTQKMIESVESSQSDSLKSLIPKVSIDNQGLRIAASTGTTAVERAQTMELAEALSKNLRINIMNYILSNKTVEDVIRIIETKKFLNENTVKLLIYGLKKFNEQDYISSIHILIPKIESVLRDIITNKLGLSGIRFRRYGSGYEYITLGSILKGETLKKDENIKIEEYLGRDFRDYLYYKLSMSEGQNLRDALAHGILTIEEMNYEMCLDIIYLLMRILK